LSEKDGGPAFPIPGPKELEFTSGRSYGMTMRQYYKAAAITGITASPSFNPAASEVIAGWVSRIADAMLAEDAAHEGKKG